MMAGTSGPSSGLARPGGGGYYTYGGRLPYGQMPPQGPISGSPDGGTTTYTPQTYDPYAQQRYENDQYTNTRARDVGAATGLKALSASYGPGGEQVSYGMDPSAALDAQLGVRDKYNQAADARWMAELDKYINSPVQSGIRRDTGPIHDAEMASENAGFARAKDRTGLVARGAVESLQDVLGGRNMLGSGMEQTGYTNILNKGQQDLADVTREQAIGSADRAEHRADVDYQGAVAQRGQDISRMQSLMALMRRQYAY